MSDASTLANSIATSLLAGADFTVDMPDFTDPKFNPPATSGYLYDAIEEVDTSDVTEGDTSLTGSGMFDLLMKAFKAHLKEEFEKNRISGAEYTKAYIALTEAAMGNSVQFVLGKALAHWQTVNSQLQARIADIGAATARVQLESAKVQLEEIRLRALNEQANYALNKMRLANEDAAYETATYNLEQILPKNALLLDAQAGQVSAETVNLGKQGLLLDDEHALAALKSSMLTNQVAQVAAETARINTDEELLTARIVTEENQAFQIQKQSELTVTEINLGVQKLALLTKQVASEEARKLLTEKQVEQMDEEIALYALKEKLLEEQVETQRAETLDTRTTGMTIAGTKGQQKALYAQQIESYQRDAEIKAARIFADAFITMKTLDEGLTPPTAYANANLDVILGHIKSNNGL